MLGRVAAPQATLFAGGIASSAGGESADETTSPRRAR
jgi:hypothetical protein